MSALSDCHSVRVVLFSISLFCFSLCFSGCTEKSEWEQVDIKTNGIGFINNENETISIKGSWYWYQNSKSKITDITVKVVKGDQTENHIWYSDTDSAHDGALFETLNTQKVCIAGHLEKDNRNDQFATGYVGIGFDLCTTDDDDVPIRFPHTVGTCPYGGGELLKKFLGVSFTVEFKEKFPESSKFIVQFKERGKGLDALQPYCYLKNSMATAEYDQSVQSSCRVMSEDSDDDSNTDAYLVEAWHGETTNPEREDALLGKSLDIDPEHVKGSRNLRALQGIHFQIESDNSQETTEFDFCLSEIKAIVSRKELPVIGDTDLYLGETNTDEVIISNTVKLESLAPEVEQFNSEADPNDIWIDAKTASERDTALLGDYPGSAESDEGTQFWIMKEEVSAAQFNACIEAEVCDPDIRQWASCSVYRFQEVDEEDPDYQIWGQRSANCINWEEADKFCRWIGGRLPTQKQWEYAAASGYNDRNEAYPYPWGNNTPSCTRAIFYNSEGIGCGNGVVPLPGCTLDEGTTSTKVCDMIGNLWEWVSDTYTNDQLNWMTNYHVIKGGGFNTKDKGSLSIDAITSAEHRVEPHNPNRLGFRCIKYDL